MEFADTRDNEPLGSELVSLDVSEGKGSKVSNLGNIYYPASKDKLSA
jgi:hypothetical protein